MNKLKNFNYHFKKIIFQVSLILVLVTLPYKSLARIIHDNYDLENSAHASEQIPDFHGFQESHIEEQHQPIHVPEKHEHVVDYYVSISDT